MGKKLKFLIWFFFFVINLQGRAYSIVEAYFEVEESISASCYKALENSLLVIHPDLRYYLTEAIHKRNSRFQFMQVSTEEARQMFVNPEKRKKKYNQTVYGIPTLFASSTTIFRVGRSCSIIDAVITHEIGHLIHFAIKAYHTHIASQWDELWHEIFKKYASPQDPLAFLCPFHNCPFIGWKDVDNEREGFAQLILAGTSHGDYFKENENPDFQRKMEFLDMLIDYSKKIQP